MRFRFSIAGAGTAEASNALPQREYRNGPQHAGCYHTTVNAPAGEKTALAAVFMASCSGSKEVDFCEMNKFVAAISHAVNTPTAINLSRSWLNENVRPIDLRRMEPLLY